MKAFRKDFFREILRNKGRFLSVFFISLLGAAFFSGIRSAEGDMKTSADAYYDQTNYMDLRVLGTLGLTDTDMEDIAKVKGVAQVTGGHTLEVLHKEGEKEQTVKLIALEDGVNEPQILDGRLPQKTDEILVDQKFLDGTGKKIGDQVTFESGTDTVLSDDLVHGTFTIVGSATLPYYMELTVEREVSETAVLTVLGCYFRRRLPVRFIQNLCAGGWGKGAGKLQYLLRKD